MRNDLNGHTINIRNWISVNEAGYLCKKYNQMLCKELSITGIKIAGINQINLKRNKVSGKVDRYDIEIQINMGRLLRVSNVSMVPINKKMVQKMIKKLTDIFREIFHFHSKHVDAAEWFVKRLDCGVDLHIGTDNPMVLREHIKLLHDSFDVNNSKKIAYSTYKTNKSLDDIKYESITLTAPGEATGDQKYKYNIYYKLQQKLAEGANLTAAEQKEIADVIRIEKQIYQVDKVFKCSSKLSTLMDENLTEHLMDGICQEMLLLFGEGNYYVNSEGMRVIYDSDYEEEIKADLGLMYVNIRGLGYKKYVAYETEYLKKCNEPPEKIEERIKTIEDQRKKLENLGISVASTDVEQANININELLAQQFISKQKPRKKAQFGTPRIDLQPSGNSRFKCNISLHNYDGSMRRRMSIASSVGGTKEDCEREVFNKIIDVFKDNMQLANHDICIENNCKKYCKEDLEAFKSVVKSINVRKSIVQFIDNI